MRIPFCSVRQYFCVILLSPCHCLTVNTLQLLSFSMSNDVSRSHDKCVIFLFSEYSIHWREQGTSWGLITLAPILLFFFVLDRNKSHEIVFVVKLPIWSSWTHAICGSAFMPINVTACATKHEHISYAQIQCASVDHIKKKKKPTPPTTTCFD